jgi:hypothetical protein
MVKVVAVKAVARAAVEIDGGARAAVSYPPTQHPA